MVSLDEPSADTERFTLELSETAQDDDQYFCYTVSAYRGDVVSPPALSQDMCIRIEGNPDIPVPVYVSWNLNGEADGYRVQYYQGYVEIGDEPAYGDAKLQLIAEVP